MLEILPDRLPWFVAGPVMGLCVVALYALINRPLGVSGSYAQVAVFFRDRAAVETWRLWFLGGLIGGAAVAAVLRGGPAVGLGYGALGRVVPLAALVPILLAGGLLMGYGARWAGGCTSGHGLRGSSTLSPASLVATLTFMGTAVGLTLLLHAVTGGAL